MSFELLNTIDFLDLQSFNTIICKYKKLYLSLLHKKQNSMPTLLIAFGIRFFFYLDEHEPIHVHVSYGGKKAKIELVPEIRIVYNHGLKEQEMKKAVSTCKNYRDDFIAEWHRRFG